MGRKEEIDSFIEVLRFVPVFRDSGILYDKVIEDVITNNY